MPNPYLYYLTDPNWFQGVNSLFVLSFENNTNKTVHIGYYLPEVKHNVVIDGQIFFDQPVKSNMKTYDNIRNNATGQGDDYATWYLLGYPYFKDH